MGARVRTGTEVVSIDSLRKTVTLRGGDTLTADIIVGADGPYGKTRRLVMGEEIAKTPMGFMMYE